LLLVSFLQSLAGDGSSCSVEEAVNQVFKEFATTPSVAKSITIIDTNALMLPPQ
jgi:hypothetical protein